MIGQTLGHYRILEQIGAGGMGVVYRARDTRLERDVALKLLPASALADPNARERLLREARTASQLNHPNICTIHEVGEAGGQLFIAMELVKGQALNTRISRQGLPTESVVRYGMQIADALAHAHEHGVVHRDMKSANIVITPEGRAKVLDFGLAVRRKEEIDKATRSRISLEEQQPLAGTLAYIAPEVLRGQPADARSDIWALGVMLFEMCAGELPFRGQTGFDLSSSILRDPMPALPPHIPPALGALIRRCLEKDPAQRYQRAGEILAALEMISAQPLASLLPPSVPAPIPAAAPPARPRHFLLSWQGGVALGVLAVLAATLAFIPAVRQRIFGGGAPDKKIESLAVLPLDNMSGNPAQEYFADGMTEALISNLAQIPALRVISRTTVMRYKGTKKSLPEIAQELGVDAVIEGSVTRSNDRVRVTAQMIEAATDRHLWAKEYDRDLRDVLALQSEVARAIAREIQVEVTPEVSARLATRYVVNPEAYDAFLRGRAVSRRENREDNDAAIELLEKAASRDSQFAAAYAELGRAYRIRSFFFAPQEKLWLQRAREAIDRALTLDPDSADAHLARGALLWTPAQGFQHEQAIREFRRAIELKPSLDEAHHQLGLVLVHVGLFEEAQRATKAAVILNPGNTLALYRTGEVMIFQGKYQQALDVISRIPGDFNPPLVAYENAWALFYLGRKKEALATTESCLREHSQDEGGLCTSMQALFAADAGDARHAEAKIQRAAALGKGYGHFHHTAYNIALSYALLKRPAEALKWLQAAADDGMPCYPLFEKDPSLDRIRRDLGFAAFLAKQKQQWEAFKKL